VTVFGEDDWKDCSAVTFRVRQSEEDEDEGMAILQNIRNYLPKLQCPR